MCLRLVSKGPPTAHFVVACASILLALSVATPADQISVAFISMLPSAVIISAWRLAGALAAWRDLRAWIAERRGRARSLAHRPRRLLPASGGSGWAIGSPPVSWRVHDSRTDRYVSALTAWA